ncbi:MAG TPA: TIGR03809 family protein [Pseudolabrys sp.]|nr:TIGR03809 family protein [Pseudolabrys sp.]
MQDLSGRLSLQPIARKWLDLAERRLEYYTELYRSGRYRRYYTEDRFAIRMLDVIEATRRWYDLAAQQMAGQAARQAPRDDQLRPAA